MGDATDSGTRAESVSAAAPPSVPGRLAWRCRRGMKELDLLLLRYLHGPWQQAGEHDRAAFERLLELPDPQLAACLARREPAPDAALERVLCVLRGA